MRVKLTANGKVPLSEKENLYFDKMEAEYEAGADDRAASEIRAERDSKLAKTDWTQVIDAPVDQEAWATYRQALRDLPSQEGFPNEVTWPTEPVEAAAEEAVSEAPVEAVVVEEPVEEVTPE